MTLSLLGRLVGAGVLSTLTMDLLATGFRKLGLTAGVPPELLARWFGSLLKGRWVHHTIVESPDVPGGMGLMMACHYLIGIGLTVVFWMLLRQTPLKDVTPAVIAAAAVGFGILTNVLPWLVMFPSMGFGLLGRDAPDAMLLLRTSFVNHLAFGLGLAWTAVAVMRVRS